MARVVEGCRSFSGTLFASVLPKVLPPNCIGDNHWHHVPLPEALSCIMVLSPGKFCIVSLGLTEPLLQSQHWFSSVPRPQFLGGDQAPALPSHKPCQDDKGSLPEPGLPFVVTVTWQPDHSFCTNVSANPSNWYEVVLHRLPGTVIGSKWYCWRSLLFKKATSRRWATLSKGGVLPWRNSFFLNWLWASEPRLVPSSQWDT